VRDARRGAIRARQVASINAILSAKATPDTRRSEADFESLQNSYQPRPEYGYSSLSLFERAANRATQVLKRVPPGNRTLRFLDVGAGDGMLGVLFAAAGHDVTLCDLEDWRTNSAKGLRFIAADCCVGLPRHADEFDLVCSFNSFEHFVDPSRAFAEMLRVTAPGGLIYLDFGPLYCSPWGLHAYRSLRMPYPQFLFSPTFTSAKLKKLGVFDLGKSRNELQNLNRWKFQEFAAVWNCAKTEIIASHLISDEKQLNIIVEYPECFRGRGLSFQDVTCSNVIIVLKKRI